MKTNRRFLVGCGSILLGLWLGFIGGVPACLGAGEIDPHRVQEITAWLPAHPIGFGQPITNRLAWTNLAALHPELQPTITQAAKLAREPLPEQPDALFLEYTRNGNRTRWQSVANARRGRIQTFTLAECLENRGRFLAPLEQTIAALCRETTWVMPAHDARLANFRGETTEIDLGSSALGLEIATADYLLGDRLSAPTRKLIRENLDRRIFGPYRAAATGKRKAFWWMQGANNWNSVCLNGVTGTALAIVEPAAERAWYLAVAEKNVEYYLAGGFTPDGYCVEGLGYWNFGYGEYALLAENIRQATGGRVDWLLNPAAWPPAQFGRRSEILSGLHTAIADCHPDDQPKPGLMEYLGQRFRWDHAPAGRAKLAGGLYEKVGLGFLPAELPRVPAEAVDADLPWRSWFPDAGVLVCRPGPGAVTPFAVAIKGGNNGVSHGHHDAGSFSVVAGKAMVICDPGGEVYTSRTFSAHRFDSKVLNSFGHAVPVIAGQLQKPGAAARAVVLATNFTATTDELRLDLRSAYAAPELQKLERTFVYERGEKPSLTIRDEVAFRSPATFATTLVTWGTTRQTGPGTWEITDGDAGVRVTIDSQSRPYDWSQEVIEEEVSAHRKPNRVLIRLNDPIPGGIITLRIEPLPK